MNYIFEGRREDILKKYMGDFDISVLDAVLNDPFTKSSNYKYADWILKKLEFNSLPLALEVLELVKQFDRVGKNLEIKDINQYPDVVELRAAIEDYGSKSQRKKIESEAKKIYEDNRVLIVKPLSHAASCKYGAGTKWCTTQASPGYYEKYTMGNEALYYILMKDFDISNKFYKIALHKGTNMDTWYDSHDTVMPPREVDILKVGLGKMANKMIEDDYNENKNKSLKELFDPNNQESIVVTDNLFGTRKKLTFKFSDPFLIDTQHAEMNLKIYLDDEKIEDGRLAIMYRTERDGNTLYTDYAYVPDDEFTPPVEIKSLLYTNPSFGNFDLNSGNVFKSYCNRLAVNTFNSIKNDESFRNYVLGGKKSWNPNRSSYGFTFERKGGLINKLVDYLDSGKEGNAMDFLEDAKVVKTVVYPHGTKKYVGKRGFIEPKGYFSSFFASASKAGIISYMRKNKKNILVKGPNFEDFKKGNLVPL